MRFAILFEYLFFVTLCCILYRVEAVRCFNCSGVTQPDRCAHVTTCGSGESCYIELDITTTGVITYTSGCKATDVCDNLPNPVIGRRNVGDQLESTLFARSSFAACVQCCAGDFCNNEGCNSKAAVPRDQRGPYCYTCDAQLDPANCEHVSVCSKDEQCVVDTPIDTGSFQFTYRSMCVSKASCQTLSSLAEMGKCDVKCCDSDFCNDHCTPIATTAAPTPMITTELSVSTCNTSDGYISLSWNKSADDLCIKVHLDHQMWLRSREKCHAEGADLVVLDHTEKVQIVKRILLMMQQYYNTDSYWIGANDRDLQDKFHWVNGNFVTDGDWDAGQPDHHGNGEDQDCVRINDKAQYLWHDEDCYSSYGYICERL